jgi:putative ABC transport system ATP-binding protein
MAYIEFKNVDKIYQMGEVEIKALNKASFEIEKGELVVILGPSGAGKTTCLNILGGMDSATRGKVLVDNKDITNYSDKELIMYRRNDIGFVFQFYNLVQNLTALENVELAVQLCKDHLNPKTILNKVGLQKRMDNFPSQLSGGEQQRVAIARAIVNSPKLLICDEPTGNLDPDTSLEVMKVIEKINDLGTTVVMATHDREMVNKMKKRVVLLDNGKLVKDYEKGSYTHYESN